MSEAGRTYELAGKRVWVAGHRGMVGSALVRRLATENCEILTVSRSDVDLRRQAEVENWDEGSAAAKRHLHRGGPGRRNSGERYVSGGLPLR